MRLFSRALLTLGVTAAAACAPTPPAVLLSCDADRDCARGYVCVSAADGARRCEAHDAGSTPLSDAAIPDDAGANDAGANDAGANDAGANDAGANDAGANDAGATDAGANDAGANDAGANDAGPNDAGPNDAGALESDWPAVGWSFRHRLTLAAPDEAVAAGAPIRVSLGDTDTLMSSGRALLNGDDLRLWHFDGQSWRELARVLSDPGSLGGFRGTALEPPHVMVRAVRPIAHSSSDDHYWLFYDNPSAGPPPTAGVPAQRSKLAFGSDVVATESTTLTDVGDIAVQASSSDEAWIVMVTWQQRFIAPDNFNQPVGAAQLLVDGTPLTDDVVQTNRSGSGSWCAGIAMTALRGDTAPHTVTLRFSAQAFEGTTFPADIRDVRFLAFVVPTRGSETVVKHELPIKNLVGHLATQTYATGWTLQLTARPTSAYLWLSQTLASEGPGVAAGTIRLYLDSDVVRVTRENWLYDGMFHTLFHAGVVSLDVPHTARLDYVASENEGSSVAGVTNVALPLEGFRYQSLSAASATTASLSDEVVMSLDVPSTTLAHEYLYLGAVGNTHDAESFPGEQTAVSVELVGDASETLGLSQRAMGRDKLYVMSLGVGSREVRSTAASLRVLARTESAAVPARVESPFLMWLRYPEVSTTAGAEEPAP